LVKSLAIPHNANNEVIMIKGNINSFLTTGIFFYLIISFVDLYTVQKLLCHKDASMTQRYAHLADKVLRDAVNLSDDLLEPKGKTEVVNLEDHKNGKW